MKDYEADDLRNVLFYIKNNFGLEVFLKKGKLTAFFSDLAPSLKAEKRMLGLLLQLGILEDLLMCIDKNDADQYHAVKMAFTRLVDNEYIQPEIAIKYLNVVAGVMGIKVPSDILCQATIVEKDNNTDYRDTILDTIEVSVVNMGLSKTIAKPIKLSSNRLKKRIDYLSCLRNFLNVLVMKIQSINFYKKIFVCTNKVIKAVKVPLLIILGFSGIILGYLSVLFAFNKFMTWLATITPASSGFFKSLIAIILMVLGFIPQLIINIPFSIINLLYYLITGDWLSAPGLDGYSGFFF